MQHEQLPEKSEKQAGRDASNSSLVSYLLERLQRRGHDITIQSLGEYALPFFLAAMEACWFNAMLIGLAGLDFLHSGSALLPFWGPPLLLFTGIALFRRALRKEAEAGESPTEEEGKKSSLAIPGLRLMFGVLALLALLLIWLHLYSSTDFLLDPAWLLAFVGDLLTLNTNFYQALTIVAVTIYFCWRGINLATLHIEPGHVFRRLWVGLLILLAAVLLRASHLGAGGNADDVVLVLLIPIFLYLALSAHALARIIFIRRDHPFGLEGNAFVQERATLNVITGVGLVLLVLTILGSGAFSPAFFNALQPVWQFLATAYSWLVNGFANLIAWILTPFFELSAWFFALFPKNAPKVNPPAPVGSNPTHPLQISPASPGVVVATHILLPVLLLLVLALLIWLALRRRRRLRVAFNRKGGDIHESVWSWALFWKQFKAIWLALLQRFFPKRAAARGSAQQAEDLAAAPAARTVREIYRALLQRAATRGHLRTRAETPHEFQLRLDEREPENEPQLGLLTEAYAQTRYGGFVPDEHELTAIRRFWNELEQKWEMSS